MKKFIILFLIAFAAQLHATEKIEFIDNDWQKAFTIANQTNKYVFVDCYTDWCYWCKVMVKETFSKNEVADVMNKNFIPLKMEMEHNFGKKLAMKYGITGYPTYLIFNPEGKLVYRAVGYMDAAAFLQKLNESRDPSKQKIAPGISDKVELDFPDFYVKAFEKGAPVPDSLTLLNYFNQQQNLQSEVNFDIMGKFVESLPGKYQQYFLRKRDAYAALYSHEAVNEVIYSLAYQKLGIAIAQKSEAQLNNTYSFIDTYFSDAKDKQETTSYYGIQYYLATNDWKKFGEQVDKFIKANGHENINAINEWAWGAYVKCDDNTVIEKAIGWMKPVIDTQPKYAYTDTYASLLYKAKKYTDAEAYAQKAIDLGKKEGQKTDETEALLVKIKQAK